MNGRLWVVAPGSYVVRNDHARFQCVGRNGPLKTLYRDRTVLQNSKESIYETANGSFGKFFLSLSFSAMMHKVYLQYNLTSQKAQDLPETVYPA